MDIELQKKDALISACTHLEQFLDETEDELLELDMTANHNPSTFVGEHRKTAISTVQKVFGECLKFEKAIYPDTECYELTFREMVKHQGKIDNKFDQAREPGHEEDDYPPDFGHPAVSRCAQRVYAARTACRRIIAAVRFYSES